MVEKKKKKTRAAKAAADKRPDWVKRLVWARKQFYSSADKAVEELGWNKHTYKALEKGARGADRPPLKLLSEIATAYHVTLSFILEGKDAPPAYLGVQSDLQLAPRAVRTVPKYSLKQAVRVLPQKPLPEHETTAVLTASPALGPRIFALELVDDSMVSPNPMNVSFRPGDEIFVDPDATAKPGDFIVAQMQGSETVIFRLYRSGGRDQQGNDIVELVPLNQNYRTELLGRRGRIVGKMVRRYDTY